MECNNVGIRPSRLGHAAKRVFAIRHGSLWCNGTAIPRRYLRSVIVRMRFAKNVAYPNRSVVVVVLVFFVERNGQRLASLFAGCQRSNSQTWCERRMGTGTYVHRLFLFWIGWRTPLVGGLYCERTTLVCVFPIAIWEYVRFVGLASRGRGAP